MSPTGHGGPPNSTGVREQEVDGIHEDDYKDQAEVEERAAVYAPPVSLVNCYRYTFAHRRGEGF